jgi:ABC-type tungstate transport system permease subunit
MFHRKPILAFVAVFCGAIFSAGPVLTQEKSIVVTSTTSTKDSGLFGRLLPIFTEKTGIAVKVLAVGMVKRSTLLGAVRLMLFLYMLNRQNRGSSPKDMA